MASIAATGVSALKKLMDDTTADPVKNCGGVVFAAVNKQGESIFEHASGTAGVGIDTAITTDYTFWIASCTKMITGIACMQLVEHGKLALDDVELVETLCPVCLSMKTHTDSSTLTLCSFRHQGTQTRPGHRRQKARA